MSYAPSPAVKWLEEDPESPYNLENTGLSHRLFNAMSPYWEGPHRIYKGRGKPLPEEPGVSVSQPMIWLKVD
jgi:hypothetical protein